MQQKTSRPSRQLSLLVKRLHPMKGGPARPKRVQLHKKTDRTQERRLPIEGEQAEETESSTTDELDDSTEAIPEQTASSSQDTKVLTPASTAQHSAPCLPTAWEAATNQQQVGTKRPVPGTPLDEADDQRKPLESTRTEANTNHEVESGHPCGCPLVPLSENSPVTPPIEEAKRRSKWASSPPAVSAAPPPGVDRQGDLPLAQIAQPARLAVQVKVWTRPLPHRQQRGPGCRGLLQSSPRWPNQLSTHRDGIQSKG